MGLPASGGGGAAPSTALAAEAERRTPPPLDPLIAARRAAAQRGRTKLRAVSSFSAAAAHPRSRSPAREPPRLGACDLLSMLRGGGLALPGP
jgi:hypothetical protein